MSLLLFLTILSQNQSDIDDFINNTAPHLNYLVNGTEILSDSKLVNFGIEGIYSDYKLIRYDQVVRVPSFNGFITYKINNFIPYLKLGFYPKTSNTNKAVPLVNIGFNLIPNFSNFLIFRFGYGTLASIEYFPGDPYYNYDYKSIRCLNLSLVGFKKLSIFTPFLTAGLLPSYISGKYRNDINQSEENFNNFSFGWHLGLGFKIFFVKLNVELVNSRLSASTSFTL
jgi:hypothetical protein